MNPMKIPTAAALLLGALASSQAGADEPAGAAPPKHFKFAIGSYFYDDPAGNYAGQDLNLRYRRGDSTVFAGYYHDREFGGQARTGFDTSWQPFDAVPVSILPALAVATRGFVGGSLAAQVGTAWYAQVGIGRTNLRPFANLNFDPNDALAFAVGHHAEDGSSYSLTTVADNRLHTGQRHTHLVGQWPLFDGQRLTIDILRKTGDGDTGHVSAWGETVTWDFPRWFLRESYDPKQNFAAADVTRISIGARF
ncbi:MAG: hypothetical protein NVS9B10_10690 [Nevskia sp.]